MKANFILIVTVFSFLFCGCNQTKKEKVQLYEPTRPIVVNSIDRGKQLVNSIGCQDCHSPKKFTKDGIMSIDEDRMLSGYPSSQKLSPYDKNTASSYVLFSMEFTSAIGPWGTSFAANLTPDDTGIGTWTEAQFLNAIKNGKYKGLDGSRDLLPPMPWQWYRNLTDDDIKAIYAYLKTIKPIENIVPAAILPEAK